MTLAATRTRGSKVVGYEQGGQRLTIEGGNEIDFCHEAEEGNGNDFEDDITPLFMRLLGALEQRSALQQQLVTAPMDTTGNSSSSGGGGDELDNEHQNPPTSTNLPELLPALPLGVHSTNTLDQYCYLLVPGLLSQYSPPLYFTEALHRLRDILGLDAEIVALDSEASTAVNARAIQESVTRISTTTGKLCVLMGHSKGGIDSAAALAMFPDLRSLVAGLVFLQTPYRGSPVAADMLQDEVLRHAVGFIAAALRTKADAPYDLTYVERRAFLAKHPLTPHDLSFLLRRRYRLSRCHPNVSSRGSPGGRRGTKDAFSPLVFPMLSFSSSLGNVNQLSALISPFALTAAYMKGRYGQVSDGMVTALDAEVPGSSMVRYRATVMDHLGPVYPTVNGMLDGVASRVASSKVASRMASRVASSVASSVAVVNRAQRSLWQRVSSQDAQRFGFGGWRMNLSTAAPAASHSSPYLAPAGADVCEALLRVLLLHFSFPG